MVGSLCKLCVILVASLSLGSLATAQPLDYDARFAAQFPAVGSGHRIASWELYAALSTNDLVAYAVAIDPAVAARRDELRGRAYQTEEWRAGLARDPRLRGAFDGQRRRLAGTVVYFDVNGTPPAACVHALVYVDHEFRIVLGEGNERADTLAFATVAPSCRQTMSPGFQVTAGRSYRFRCWSGQYDKTCGWRLPDMPESLKSVVESDYPKSIRLLWHWRGLGGVARVRYLDADGNGVSEHDSVLVNVPTELGLDFVDAKGRILWTANAGRTRGAGGALPHDRRLPAISLNATR